MVSAKRRTRNTFSAAALSVTIGRVKATTKTQYSTLHDPLRTTPSYSGRANKISLSLQSGFATAPRRGKRTPLAL
jgi:hypothetical protein